MTPTPHNGIERCECFQNHANADVYENSYTCCMAKHVLTNHPTQSVTPHLKDVSKRVDLAIAQACPFTVLKLYADADFEIIRKMVFAEITTAYNQGREDESAGCREHCDSAYERGLKETSMLVRADEEIKEKAIKAALTQERVRVEKIIDDAIDKYVEEISSCCGARGTSSGIPYDGTNEKHIVMCKKCGGEFIPQYIITDYPAFSTAIEIVQNKGVS